MLSLHICNIILVDVIVVNAVVVVNRLTHHAVTSIWHDIEQAIMRVGPSSQCLVLLRIESSLDIRPRSRQQSFIVSVRLTVRNVRCIVVQNRL